MCVEPLNKSVGGHCVDGEIPPVIRRKGPLKLSADKTELISKGAGLAYPIRDGIPVMLESEARTLTTDERLDK